MSRFFRSTGMGAAPCSKAVAGAGWTPTVNTTFCLQGFQFFRGSTGSDLTRSYPAEVNSESMTTPPIYYVQHRVSSSLVSDAALASMRVGVYTCAAAGDASTAAACMTAAGPVAASMAAAVPCRKLSTLHDSLFTLAKDYRSDWITVWSMNDGNPDLRRTVEPRYFAHPFLINKGETAYAIERRFGVSANDLLLVNPGLASVDALPVGSAICVVPSWFRTMSGSGQPICSAAAAA